MIANLIEIDKIHRLARPQSPEKQYTTFIEFDELTLLGRGGQNPINAGSSMLQVSSDPKMVKNISDFVNSKFSKNNYICSYQLKDEELIYIVAKNLTRFKMDIDFRRRVLNSMFKPNSIEFQENIYAGYIFIAIAIYFLKEKNLYSLDINDDKRKIMDRYFNSDNEFWEQVYYCLNHAVSIENLTAFCHGRYFFVDDKLSDYSDSKPIQKIIIEILKGVKNGI